MRPSCPVAGPSYASSSTPADNLSSRDSGETESRQSESMSAASTMWFSLDEDASSSWPPKLTFSSPRKSPQSSHIPSPDRMEGIIAQRPQSSRTRSATRAIPNRSAARPYSLTVSVPTTPTSLWRQVPDPKQDALLTRGLFESDKCTHPPIGTGRIRASPSLIDMEPKPRPCPDPGRRDGYDAHREADPYAPSSLAGPSPAPIRSRSEPSVLTRWGLKERKFRELWSAQKDKNPHLPLIVSPFNPLRALMPPLYWKSIAPTQVSGLKVEWNFQKPLPSSALRLKMRSRKDCDAAAERFSAKAIFKGKLRHHCRACKEDTLLKRLLRFNYWIIRADGLFESALSLLPADADDYEMDDAGVDDDFPEGVLLRDRDDFDDDDRAMDDDVPLIVERDLDCTYPYRLF